MRFPVLALLGALAPAVSGQAVTSTILAEAGVSTTAVSVSTLQDVAFGLVPNGIATTTLPTAAQAGKFEIHGNRNAEVNITFTLPTQMRQAATGRFPMPIAFGAQSACHRNRDQQNQCTPYNPATPLTVRLRNNPAPNNTYYVWIGATVAPALNQQPGNYEAPITISVIYTGN